MKKIDKQFFADIARSVFIGILVSFALVLLFAVFVKSFSLSDDIIAPVNVGIKTFCILVGVLSGLKDRRLGWLKGLLAGLIYIFLSFLIFAALDGGFNDIKLSVFDIITGAVVGIIAGITKVNLPSHNKSSANKN